MKCKALAVRKSGRTLKTLLTAIVVFASMITGMAQVPSYVPTSGLVGWWPFNGNANDESGNGNNGTVNGATLTADRNGNANTAYSLNGVNNWVQTNSSFLQTDMPHTISIWWLTSDSTKTNQTLFNTGPHTLENLAFHYSSSNPNPPYGVSYGMGNGLTGSGSWNIMNPDNGQVAMNGDFTKWHNCIWVKDSTYKWSIYIDGVLSNNFISTLNTGSQLANLRFGAENNGVPTGGANFKGSLDDIGIWNRALTQQEITNLYTASTPPPCNPLAANLMNGLVGYWPFCGNANDESGNGNNGTVNGATLTADRNGNANAAYSFDGNGDYIDCGNNSSLNLSNSFTISAWVNGNTFAQEKGIVSKSQGATPYTYDLIVSNNGGQKVRFDINQNYLFSNQNLNTNNWYNIVATYNGSIQSIYIDGVLSSSQNVSTILSSVADHLLLGAHQVSVVPSWSWDGKLDDIAIWNRALTQNEITQLYTGSPCINYQVITVTDTLIINANLTGINPVTFQNAIKVYPNPSSTQITIDFGANYTTMASYTMRIQNAVGQTVYTTGVTQQQFTSNLSTWTGNGIYFVYLIDAQGNTVDVKKIILQ
ncbi:MAG: hypothetical protein RL516_2118 [Bacteroidota bacterium]|jgi:hypothetical protein